MIENKINGKQTKLTWKGVKYKAIPQVWGCDGCAFFVARFVACEEVPCCPSERRDGQSIIWVKRKNQPTQGE